jgi:hypothetical protein
MPLAVYANGYSFRRPSMPSVIHDWRRWTLHGPPATNPSNMSYSRYNQQPGRYSDGRPTSQWDEGGRRRRHGREGHRKSLSQETSVYEEKVMTARPARRPQSTGAIDGDGVYIFSYKLERNGSGSRWPFPDKHIKVAKKNSNSVNSASLATIIK